LFDEAEVACGYLMLAGSHVHVRVIPAGAGCIAGRTDLSSSNVEFWFGAGSAPGLLRICSTPPTVV
jgi:hypothetical protein